jgi:N-acetylglucosaminyldiphosphoundecaprenol N-acetyl-beta-D-mannosaminyltransferase
MAQRIRASGAELVLVALGAPKQEIWIHRHRAQLGGAVAVGVGASLAFLSGRVSRCPRWMARAGLEWLFRLGCEPRRLWRRYLVEDVAFVPILLRTWRGRRLARLEQIRPGGSSSSRAAPAARSPRPGGGPPGAEPSAPTYVHGP